MLEGFVYERTRYLDSVEREDGCTYRYVYIGKKGKRYSVDLTVNEGRKIAFYKIYFVKVEWWPTLRTKEIDELVLSIGKWAEGELEHHHRLRSLVSGTKLVIRRGREYGRLCKLEGKKGWK